MLGKLEPELRAIFRNVAPPLIIHGAGNFIQEDAGEAVAGHIRSWLGLADSSKLVSRVWRLIGSVSTRITRSMQEKAMKIYNSSTAPNPRRVRVFLAEKGIQVPYEEVDLVKAVNRGPEFRKKNPLATVPVLELDDGTCVSESAAICRYFEELRPNPPLFGVNAKERALVDMWSANRICCAPANRRRIQAAPRLRLNAKDGLKWLDEELGSRRYIARDNFTIADITAMIAVDFGRVSKIAIKPEQKNLARWHAEVAARPSAKA
jgi:glutathione S-transferase